MMSRPKTYIAGDAEAKRLHDGTQTMLVIPFTKQPPFDYFAHANGNLYGCRTGGASTGYVIYPDQPHIISSFYKHGRDLPDIVCPYAPGDVIAVKEAWEFRPMHGKQTKAGRELVALIGYRADSATCVVDVPATAKGKVYRGWRPARSMPLWAVRTRLTVQSVDCREQDGRYCWFVEVRK